MDLLSKNVNTTSHSNYDEDFKKYISGMKGAYENLCIVVQKHGQLVYDIDYEYRACLRDNLELLEITLIKMLKQNGAFRPDIYHELFDFYTKIANLTLQAKRHDFLLITTMQIQVWSDFVLKNTK